jgi:hypothetical protein
MKSILAAAASVLALAAVTAPAAAQDWRALAQQDLQAAHNELRENHPAIAVDDATSPAIRAWLDAGLAETTALLPQVNSGNAYAYALRSYARGFRDSNIQIEPTWETLPVWYAATFPNFSTAWRGGQYVVSWVKPGVRGTPPLGAAVVSCDGVPVEELAQARLDRFEGDLTREADRVRTAPYLLWNRGNPLARGIPGECSFQVGRRARSFRLINVPAAADSEAAYRASVYTPGAQPLSLETVGGVQWIHMHSLSDSANWRGFFGQIEQNLTAIQSAPGVVIDLRGAEGDSLNSTARGYGLANRLWSIDYVVPRQPAAGSLTYRATADNRQWFADTLGRMQADPEFVATSPEVVADTTAIVEAFDAALAAGQATFSLPGRASVADTGAANPMQGQVIVLIDGGCTEGCLDVVDLLSGLPNVRLAGNVTDANSIFIEPTVAALPSTFGQVSYGHKAWTTRARGSNQPHSPAQGLTYTGDAADEAAVQAWVSSLFGG